MLRINSDSTDTDDYRKKRIKLIINRKTCYTLAVLKKELSIICPNGNSVVLTDDNTKVDVYLSVGSGDYISEVDNIMRLLLPMDMCYVINLMHNTHKTIGKFKHSELKAYAYKKMRDEVL